MDFLLVLGKMLSSLFTNLVDIIILVVAVLEYWLYKKVLDIRGQVKREVDMCHNDHSKRFTEDLARRLNSTYSLFTTIITIFPLLGMFGTVAALISINMSGEILSSQQNFFDALTSTAWGIVFSLIFKVCNALIEYSVNSQIEAAEKLLDADLAKSIKNGAAEDEKQ